MYCFLAAIQIPPAMRKHRRPKGHAVTVIGLPAKKRSSEKHKLTPFIHLHSSMKEKDIAFQNTTCIILFFSHVAVVCKC